MKYRLKALYKNLIYPNLLDSQYWSAEKRKSYQENRFIKIFNYHYTKNPRYKEFCNDNGLIGKINSFKDYLNVPIITKEIFKSNPELKLKKNKYMSSYHTGGSTGEPLEYIGCKKYRYMRLQAHSRGWKIFGLQSSSDFITIASSRGNILNAESLTGDLNNHNILGIIKFLSNSSKSILRGYSSSIFLLSNKMNKLGIKLNHIKAINLISENVYDFHKKEMNIAFPKAGIFEEYVCNDGAASAWECEEHNGLHEAFERAIIEPVNKGEMIVTDLWNHAMPFIRYINGDYLIERNEILCDCGRTSPRIKVKGRTNDILISPNGPISPTYLMMWCAGYDYTGAKHNDGIDSIQYIQNENFFLTVNIKKNEKFDKIQFNRLKSEISRICNDMEISFNFVKKIKESKSGKRNFIINNDKKLLDRFLSR